MMSLLTMYFSYNPRIPKIEIKLCTFFGNISEARRLVYNQCQTAGLIIPSNQRRKANVFLYINTLMTYEICFYGLFVFLNIHFIYFKYL